MDRSAEAEVTRLAGELSVAIRAVSTNAAIATERLDELVAEASSAQTHGAAGAASSMWEGIARDLEGAAVESQVASLREEIAQAEAQKVAHLEAEAVVVDAALEAIQVRIA